MGLRERLRRLEREAEKANAPTWDRYLAATRRETARNLASAYRKLAALGGNPPAKRTRGPEGDTSEQRRKDEGVIEAWRKARGISRDMVAAHAEQARARILDMRRR